jgi:thiol-disulfide isomerase/thioredoxin
MMIRRLSIVAALAVLALLAYVVVNLFILDSSRMPATPLPDETTQVLMEDGLLQSSRDLSLRSLIGKPLLVHWWASWCAVCKADYPKIRDLSVKLNAAAPSVRFVAIATDDELGAAASAAQALAFPYLLLFEEKAKTLATFGGESLPHLCVFDQVGVSRHCWKGALTPGRIHDIEQAINQLQEQP